MDGAFGLVEGSNQPGVCVAQDIEFSGTGAVHAKHHAQVEARNEHVVEYGEFLDVGAVPFEQGAGNVPADEACGSGDERGSHEDASPAANLTF